MTPESARAAGFFDGLFGRPNRWYEFLPKYHGHHGDQAGGEAYLDGYALGAAALSEPVEVTG